MKNMKRLILAAGCVTMLSVPAFAGPMEHKLNADITSIQARLHAAVLKSNVELSPNLEQEGLSAVPLPAAGWMLLAGLGGLAAMRRRARA